MNIKLPLEEIINQFEGELYFHRIVNGEIQYQGVITELNENGSGTAYYFDWTMGQRDDTPFMFNIFFLKQCKFYATTEDMKRAYKESNK